MYEEELSKETKKLHNDDNSNKNEFSDELQVTVPVPATRIDHPNQEEQQEMNDIMGHHTAFEAALHNQTEQLLEQINNSGAINGNNVN